MADTLNPRIAIDMFFQHQLTGAQLVRELASHRGWIVPAFFDSSSPNGEQSLDATGGSLSFIKILIGGSEPHFFMFSDKQAYADCAAHIGLTAMGTHTIENIFGYNAWDAVDDDVQFVNINPFSPSEIHYNREQISMLREWGGILKVEQAIDHVLADQTGYDIIKAFPAYYVGLVREDNDLRISLAPDQRGRALAALFTSDDAAEAYMEKYGEDVELRIFDGPSLFEGLSHMEIDGLVFNCCGPIQPRAFALQFAVEVMSRG